MTSELPTKFHYRVCSRCVMDTTDPDIHFDEQGVCNHCQEFDRVILRQWRRGGEGWAELVALVEQMKAEGACKRYDCVLGLSGGADSSYVALKAKDLGLRVLCYHVDGGWNREVAVRNIERILRYCDFDLETFVVDWEEMRELQLAFLRSGIANQDVPQDHAFFAALYRGALREGIRFVLSGGNIATEAVFPRTWHGSAMDGRNLKAIYAAFGTRKALRKFPVMSFWEYYFWLPVVRRLKVVRLLNYISYNKENAIKELKERCDWRPYGHKHGESVFTRFFQNYYLPIRYGYDKRRPHYSSLILSGQMTRERALALLQQPLYSEEELEIDKAYICKKLRISRQELEKLIEAPLRSHREFANHERLYRFFKKVQGIAERVSGRTLGFYSGLQSRI